MKALKEQTDIESFIVCFHFTQTACCLRDLRVFFTLAFEAFLSACPNFLFSGGGVAVTFVAMVTLFFFLSGTGDEFFLSSVTDFFFLGSFSGFLGSEVTDFFVPGVQPSVPFLLEGEVEFFLLPDALTM